MSAPRLLVFLLLAATAAGCPLRDLVRPRPTPTVPAAPTPTPAPFTMNALPIYRLIASPAQADAPSRLIVLYVRMFATGDAPLSIRLDEVTLTLPSGDAGRVFDRPRALELVRRTTLGDVDLSYLQRQPPPPPGGLSDFDQIARSNLVRSSLFPDGAVLSRTSPLEGYVVVDTMQPLATLTGATIAGVARPLDGGVALQASYVFPSPLPATPTAGPAAPAAEFTPVPEPTPAAATEP